MQCDCGATTEGKFAGMHTKGCAALKIDWNDVPIPDRKRLDAALSAARFAMDNGGRLSEEELYELTEAARWAKHNLPEGLEFLDLCLRNPINQVYFRAGLLACREYMARFVEQGGNKEIAQSIRANWWPALGADPGPPRLFQFDEVCEEREGPGGKMSWEAKDLSPSIEALAQAHQFLASPILAGAGAADPASAA